ncbi:hypothetical protein D920_01680 [Enterococcus faecalis 13-SD-W-01]|nr:hypothetical protein D920_01680 [Enterococcus faecalis 13-SD-W-01]
MKKQTKVILGMLLAVIFGTILGSSPADASERSVGDRYDGRRVLIRSMVNGNRIVDWSQANRANVIIYYNLGRWNQEWRMSYQQANDSYIFMTGGNHENGLAAFMTARNVRNGEGRRLIGTEFTNLASMQWRLHHLGRHERGDVYILQNMSDGTVLDIPGSDVNSYPTLILHPRHGRANQQFILDVLD